jgi:hypothetical protein
VVEGISGLAELFGGGPAGGMLEGICGSMRTSIAESIEFSFAEVEFGAVVFEKLFRPREKLLAFGGLGGLRLRFSFGSGRLSEGGNSTQQGAGETANDKASDNRRGHRDFVMLKEAGRRRGNEPVGALVCRDVSHKTDGNEGLANVRSPTGGA